jgi:hypothetical protein
MCGLTATTEPRRAGVIARPLQLVLGRPISTGQERLRRTIVKLAFLPPGEKSNQRSDPRTGASPKEYSEALMEHTVLVSAAGAVQFVPARN